jgi:enoyl-CoA hydratase/carnithine racemase
VIREDAVVLGGPTSLARIVTLARSEKKNAISQEVADALADAVERASDDMTVRVIILAADGDVFAAGGDLDEIAANVDGDGVDQILRMGARMQEMETCPLPVLCALSGDVYGGGCELILLADFIIAEEHARISFRHARMGLAPAWGGTTRLLERASASFVSRILLTAETIDARTAEQAGLVSEVVPRGTSVERCLKVAGEIARASRASVAGIKASIAAARRPQREAAREGEAEVFRSLFGGSAHRGALDALNRRRG